MKHTFVGEVSSVQLQSKRKSSKPDAKYVDTKVSVVRFMAPYSVFLTLDGDWGVGKKVRITVQT